MKYFLSDILNRLQKYSASLDQSSFLVDKPWVVANNDSQYQKLIFRSDGRVHLSEGGNLTDGTWEYLPEAKALIIDYGDSKKLYRHQFLDEAVLALKIDDGKNDESDFFILANESLILDGEVEKYLEKKLLSSEEKNSTRVLLDGTEISERYLADGTVIEIRSPANSFRKIPYENGKILNDGEYILRGGEKKIIVESGFILDELSKHDYPENIVIWQSFGVPRVGDQIFGTTHETVLIEDKYGEKLKIEINDNHISRITGLTFNTKVTIAMVLFIVVIVVIILFE